MLHEVNLVTSPTISTSVQEKQSICPLDLNPNISECSCPSFTWLHRHLSGSSVSPVSFMHNSTRERVFPRVSPAARDFQELEGNVPKPAFEQTLYCGRSCVVGSSPDHSLNSIKEYQSLHTLNLNTPFPLRYLAAHSLAP